MFAAYHCHHHQAPCLFCLRHRERVWRSNGKSHAIRSLSHNCPSPRVSSAVPSVGSPDARRTFPLLSKESLCPRLSYSSRIYSDLEMMIDDHRGVSLLPHHSFAHRCCCLQNNAWRVRQTDLLSDFHRCADTPGLEFSDRARRLRPVDSVLLESSCQSFVSSLNRHSLLSTPPIVDEARLSSPQCRTFASQRRWSPVLPYSQPLPLRFGVSPAVGELVSPGWIPSLTPGRSLPMCIRFMEEEVCLQNLSFGRSLADCCIQASA